MPKGIKGFQKGHKVNVGKHWKVGRQGRENMRKAHLGKKFSEEAKRKMSKALRGSKSYLWKDGRTKLQVLIRNCYKYRQWRSDVFTRDDFTCQFCRERGVYLEADHYPKRFADILDEYKIRTLEEALNCEELWNINNGRTLCKRCHKLLHKKKNVG